MRAVSGRCGCFAVVFGFRVSAATTGSIAVLVRVVAVLVRVVGVLVRVVAAVVREGCRGGKKSNRGITFSGRRSVVGESVLRAGAGRFGPLRLFPRGVWLSGVALLLRVV